MREREREKEREGGRGRERERERERERVLFYIRGDDFLVLATDGLWDVMSSSDVAALVGRESKVIIDTIT
jgi:serine/threonine protein phosphatase PrpC